MFNSKYYKQVDSAAMESPLGLALANIFICSFESKWLRDCPNDLRPMFFRCYIDEIFVLFSCPDHADKFRLYFSSKHPNINVSIEKQEDGCLPFLDINTFCENDNLQLMSIGKVHSAGFIPTSKVLYLKHIKFV